LENKVGKEGESDGKLSVADLVRMFEDSEEATQTARKLSERDRDYVDNKQLTAAEIKALEKRGQPPTIINRIKRKVDFLVGVEKTQRVDPRALPRTPKHEADADAATEALRYVADTEDYDSKRSSVWRNMLVEGAAGISVSVEPSKYGRPPMSAGQMMTSTAMTPPVEMDIKVRKVAWDRMFADPHSSEADYSDAGYLGLVLWMDFDDALNKYRDNQNAREYLETTLGTSATTDTYDDKPKYNVWADKKRRRVRICQIWVKRGDEWHFAEYTKGGILKAGPSPYKTDKGESDCELLFQSAYVNRDNERYGIVREMISPQDEINKRRSKALHLLNVHQTTFETGAIPDIEKYRREKAKPDGTMEVAPGALSGQGPRVISETRSDLADGHFKLLQESKNEIDLMGPNGTSMGDNTRGASAASGKAIIASQQGGMIEMGDLLDSLRHLDRRVYRAIWNRIRQFWTAEKWIRITDDERNVKWVGMNVDTQQVEMAMQHNPDAAKKIAGVVGSLAELDCDIIIDDAPDSITPALEQFQALVELKKFDADNELSFRTIVRAAPNLRNKEQILAEMDKAQEAKQANPMAQQAQKIQLAGAVAQVKETESKVMLNMARAGEAQRPEMGQPAQPDSFEIPPDLQVAKQVADIEYVRANTDNKRVMTALAPMQAQHRASVDIAGLRQREQQAKPQDAA
jgi:hypothetical protein